MQSAQEQSYYEQLAMARRQEIVIDHDQNEQESKVHIGLVEILFMVGFFAFLGNDVLDWVWGLLDLGSSGFALALDWTVNNGLNFVTTGIISLWLLFRGLKPGMAQKAIIGVVVACILDSLPFVGLLPIFTIETLATIFIVNRSSQALNLTPKFAKASNALSRLRK